MSWRRWLSKGITFLLAIASVLMIWFLIREYLIGPILYLSWLLNVIYRITPQAILWGLFLLVMLLVALSGLQRRPQVIPRGVFIPPQHGERKVFRLANWVLHSHRPFYRARLNHTLTKLFLGALALRRRATEQVVRELIENGELHLPGEIQSYLQAGLRRWQDEPSGQSMWSFLRSRKDNQSKGREEFEKVILYLEEELEIRDDDWRS